MNVLFVTPEVAPHAMTRGLADVSVALPRALKRLGIDIRIIMPEYPCIAEQGMTSTHTENHALIPMGQQLVEAHLHLAEHQHLPVMLVRNREYFMRPYIYAGGPDNHEDIERFVFFCQAVLRLLPQTGFRPDIIHLNDWYGAQIAISLRETLDQLPFFNRIKTLLTIHRPEPIACSTPEFFKRLGVTGSAAEEPLQANGNPSLLKGAIHCADLVTTTSPGFAGELNSAGTGLAIEGWLQKAQRETPGILNGIDLERWDPSRDPFIVANYDSQNFSGKRDCKSALLRELGLDETEDVPLVGMVTEVAEHTGIELLAGAWDKLMGLNLQLVLLGSGDKRLETELAERSRKTPRKAATIFRYDDAMAHRIFSGCDMLLKPSLYEPCGLAQQIAMRYGSVPLVRKTGGLADTVMDYASDPDRGNGFSFVKANEESLVAAMNRALKSYSQPDTWHEIIRRGMREDFPWTSAASQYANIYEKLAGEQP